MENLKYFKTREEFIGGGVMPSYAIRYIGKKGGNL